MRNKNTFSEQHMAFMRKIGQKGNIRRWVGERRSKSLTRWRKLFNK